MLLHQQFICRCGRHYELLSSFKTDKEKRSLIEQKVKCLSCGKKMKIINTIIDKNMYNVMNHTKNRINVHLLSANNAFILCSEDSIVINIRPLLQHGFYGNISIINGRNNILVSASLHPVEGDVSFFDGNKIKESSD